MSFIFETIFIWDTWTHSQASEIHHFFFLEKFDCVHTFLCNQYLSFFTPMAYYRDPTLITWETSTLLHGEMIRNNKSNYAWGPRRIFMWWKVWSSLTDPFSHSRVFSDVDSRGRLMRRIFATIYAHNREPQPWQETLSPRLPVSFFWGQSLRSEGAGLPHTTHYVVNV